MSEGLNRVLLLGNLGKDPEFRVSQSGTGVLKLNLATTERVPSKGGQGFEDKTEWHSVTVFGKRAEGLSKILGKGDRIFVEGALRTSSYDKDGQKVYKTEVVADNVILNGSSKPGGHTAPKPAKSFGASGGFGAKRGESKDLVPPGAVDDYAENYGSADDVPF